MVCWVEVEPVNNLTPNALRFQSSCVQTTVGVHCAAAKFVVARLRACVMRAYILRSTGPHPEAPMPAAALAYDQGTRGGEVFAGPHLSSKCFRVSVQVHFVRYKDAKSVCSGGQ